MWGGTSIYALTNINRLSTWINLSRSVQRQPSLTVSGTEVVLSSDESAVNNATLLAHNLNDHWSIGSLTRTGHDDPEGQYYATVREHVGVEYNWFPSNDPRGNQLSASYLVGAEGDWYNQINDLGETQAAFPSHLALLNAGVRFDTVEFELTVTAAAELLHPDRRYSISTSGGADITLGDHLGLNFGLEVTKQAVPGPGDLDQSSYEAVTRASYAQPLQMNGNLNLNIHWDNTNSARNNRFDAASDLDTTGNL